MGLPYLPGIGDTASADLGKLGKNLNDIIHPYQDEELMLRKSLIQDPSKLDEYVSQEQDNPGFARSIGGKGFESFIRGRDTSPEYKSKQRQIQLQEKQKQAELDQTQASTTRMQQLIAQRENAKSVIAQLAKTDPEKAKMLTEKLDIGTTEDDIQETKNTLFFGEARRRGIEGSEKLKTPFDPRRVVGDVGKQKQYTPEEASYYLNPDTAIGKVTGMQFQDYLAGKREDAQWDRMVFQQNAMDDRAKAANQKTWDKALTNSNLAIARLMGAVTSTDKKKVSPDAQRNQIPIIQAELDHQRSIRESMGQDSEPLTVKYIEDLPWYKKILPHDKIASGIVIVDSQGKPVDTNASGVIKSSLITPSVGLSPKAMKVLERVKSGQATIEQMRASQGLGLTEDEMKEIERQAK